MKKKITAAVIIAAMLTLSACSGDTAATATTTAPAVTTTAAAVPDSNAADTAALAEMLKTAPLYPASTIDSAVVAKLADGTNAENPEDFEVKYNDFAVEYRLQLYGSGIDPDSEENKAYCEELRKNVIDYLTQERVILRKAQEAGFTPSALTDADCDTIIASAENAKKAGLDRFTETAKTALGEGYTDEQLSAKKQELLEEFLAQFGFTSDIYYIWERNGYLSYKHDESLIQDITIDEGEVQKLVDRYTEEAKAAYEADVSSYENNSIYPYVYVPEGSRAVRHILLNFEMETVTKILEHRNGGDNESADALRDKTYEENVKTRAEEILALLDGGKDFEEVQAEYNEDSLGSTDFVVVPGSSNWPAEFYEAAMAIETVGAHSGIVVSDFGAHILCYMKEGEVTENGIAAVCESISEYLVYQKQSELILGKTEEWKKELPTEIDYAALDITTESE